VVVVVVVVKQNISQKKGYLRRHSGKDNRQYCQLTHTHSLQYKYHPQENFAKKNK